MFSVVRCRKRRTDGGYAHRPARAHATAAAAARHWCACNAKVKSVFYFIAEWISELRPQHPFVDWSPTRQRRGSRLMWHSGMDENRSLARARAVSVMRQKWDSTFITSFLLPLLVVKTARQSFSLMRRNSLGNVFAQLPDRFAWGQHNSFFISEFRLLVDRLRLLLLHGVGLPLVNHNFHEILLFIRNYTITDFNWFFFSRNVFGSFRAPAHSWFKSDSIEMFWLASLEFNYFFFVINERQPHNKSLDHREANIKRTMLSSLTHRSFMRLEMVGGEIAANTRKERNM